MKKKELKQLAKKIAKVELKLQQAETPQEQKIYEAEIVKLTSQVDGLDDIIELDEIIAEILSKKIDF